MSNKEVKPTKRRKRKREERKTSTRVTVWQALLGFATLIGIPAFALTVLPRVAVPLPSSQVDPNNVLSVSFDISNSGLIPLNDVSAKVAIGDIGEGNDPGMHGIQSFADATGVSADHVASDAILYWWDNDGGDIVLRLQQRKAKS